VEDEFREAQRLQRWGHVERVGYVAFTLALFAGTLVVLYRELKQGASA